MKKFTVSFTTFSLVSLAVVLFTAWLAIAQKQPDAQTQEHTKNQLQSQLEQAGKAPVNNYAARSPWPQFHGDGYAQAASGLRGLEAGDTLEVQEISLPGWGGTPTQIHLSERYPDGSRTAWSATLTSVVKAKINSDEFTFAGGYKIEDRPLGGSVHWNMQLGAGNKAFVPDPKNRSILRFGERDSNDPMSEIVLEDTFVLPDEIQGKAVVLNLTFDGWLIFLTTDAWMGAVRTDFSEYRSFDLGSVINDRTVHNSFPVDENGNIFVASYYGLNKVRWTGNNLELVWNVPYDFRGPGCPPPDERIIRQIIRVFTGESCTGSGTTPTLMGRGEMDRLVYAVDSHEKNNLVAFWRDDIPSDWQGLPGQDRRVAGILQLPYSTWEGAGFTAENSPPVAGYDIAVAQYAGFSPRCRVPKGVQMARWNPDANKLSLLWSNPEVQFNNVMTISLPSNLLYGIGRGERCQYVYRGLNLDNGEPAFSLPLGRNRNYLDQGNSHALNDDRSIVFGTSTGMVRIRPASR